MKHPIIDAHQHFWQLSRPFDYRWLDAPHNAAIKRDFLPEHLASHLQTTGVSWSVFVQTQHNLEEARWVLSLAEQHPFLVGVVGWVDLASPACEEQLLSLRQHPKFVGVRHITQDEPDDDFIVRPDVLRGLKVLEKHDVPFDLLFYPRHLRHVPTLARHRPASAFSNVHCKLSGLVTEANRTTWTAADLQPYVRAAVDLFGPDRCMFGSDWPVCELAATYEQVYAALIEALGPLTEEHRAAIFGGTAQRFYRLQIPC
jgi:L-fuconolactonase